MHFELSRLYHIISSELPLNVVDSKQYAHFLSYLGERYAQWSEHYRLYFGNVDGAYPFIRSEMISLGRATRADEGQPLQDPALLNKLILEAAAVLSVSVHQIANPALFEVPGQVILHLTVTGELPHLSPPRAALHYYWHLAAEECGRLPAALQEGAIGQHTEQATRAYIHKHQQALLMLSGMVREKLPGEFTSMLSTSPREALYGMIYQEFRKLHHYLETYFYRFLDPDLPVPDAQWLTLSAQEWKELADVKEHLKQCIADPALLRIALLPLEHLTGSSGRELLTYRKVRYARLLLSELRGSLDDPDSDFSDHQLIGLLSRLNFNHLLFFNYCTDRISREAKQAEDENEELEVLRFYLKEYKQRPAVKDTIYNPLYPSLRSQVVCWLKEEIHFLEATRGIGKKDLPIAGSAQPADLKIQTKLSVAELAFLCRALYETDVFTNAQQKDVLRVIGRDFSSLKQETISLQSLLSRYYNPEAATKASVKALLQRVIRHLDNCRH